MKSKQWMTLLTIAGSVMLFSSWLNENFVERNLNGKLILIENYSRKITASKIENAILETKLWNIRNLFIQDTTNMELKKALYENIRQYQSANLKSSEIVNDAYGDLYPFNTTEINQNARNLGKLKLSYKEMLNEDSSTAKQIDYEFMMIVVRGFFPSIYSPELFESIYKYKYDYELNLVYTNRIWLYIIGSLLLAFAYILHSREEN